MKAILVIDINEADSCRAMEKWDYDDDEYLHDSKPDWCPLRPLPDKFTGLTSKDVFQSHKMGWNACINTILGEAYEENDNN